MGKASAGKMGTNTNANSANSGVGNTSKVGAVNNNKDSENFRTEVSVSADNITNSQDTTICDNATVFVTAAIFVTTIIPTAITVFIATIISFGAAFADDTAVDIAVSTVIYNTAAVSIATAIFDAITILVTTAFLGGIAIFVGIAVNNPVLNGAIFLIDTVFSSATAILIIAFFDAMIIPGGTVVSFVAGPETRQSKICEFNVLISIANYK